MWGESAWNPAVGDLRAWGLTCSLSAWGRRHLQHRKHRLGNVWFVRLACFQYFPPPSSPMITPACLCHSLSLEDCPPTGGTGQGIISPGQSSQVHCPYVHFCAVQFCAAQCSYVQCNFVPHSAVTCSTVQNSAVHWLDEACVWEEGRGGR